jgi:adenylate cyclase
VTDLSGFEALGLYDPAAPNAEERRELLEWLTARGVSLEDVVQVLERRRSLTAVAGDLALRPGPRHRVSEVAERVGMPSDRIRRISLAVGLPVTGDEAIYTEADIEMLELFGDAGALFGEAALEQFLRVVGSSLARIADAAAALFLAEVEAPLAQAQAGEVALAQANLEAIAQLAVLRKVMDSLFLGHMEAAIVRSEQARIESSSLVTGYLCVGFVDLVGFTTLSQQLPVTELRTLVDEFESAAYDVVGSRGGRVVKLIGDEVMFVAVDPVAACEIGLALLGRFGDDTAVMPRGALALGEVLTRGGDYYGTVVNLASRVADLAVPREMLVTAELRDRVEARGDPGITFSPAGRRMLKGFADPVELFALGPAADQSGAGAR